MSVLLQVRFTGARPQGVDRFDLDDVLKRLDDTMPPLSALLEEGYWRKPDPHLIDRVGNVPHVLGYPCETRYCDAQSGEARLHIESWTPSTLTLDGLEPNEIALLIATDFFKKAGHQLLVVAPSASSLNMHTGASR